MTTRTKLTATLAGAVVGSCALVSCAPARATPQQPTAAPIVDYHQHLVSAAFQPIARLPERDGRRLVAMLDSAGVSKAVVLSMGYTFADERKNLPEPDRLTRAENDWTSAQVASSNGRLIGFCSANPFRDVALAELERCLGLPGMRGIKLHFGNSGLTLHDEAHASRLAAVFALAERRRVPVLAHIRPRGGLNVGSADARLFLDRLVAVAPSIEIVVAHFGGAGSYPEQTDSVMSAFAEAAERGDPRMRNVYFDLATVVREETSAESAALIARRIRQIGVNKLLYGSDLSPPGGSIRGGWEIFRDKVPLTAAEMERIATNRPRFIR